MDNLVSELAKVTGGERTRAEECEYLLSKTQASQVCSIFPIFYHFTLIISIFLMLPSMEVPLYKSCHSPLH